MYSQSEGQNGLYNRKAFLWQLIAGGLLVVTQIIALWYKKTGPVLQWVADLLGSDLWKAFKFFSLGLVGLLVIAYALIEYKYAKGLRLLRVVSVCLGVILLVRQYHTVMVDVKLMQLPWQKEELFESAKHTLQSFSYSRNQLFLFDMIF